MINIFGFAGQIVSVASTELCCGRTQAATGKGNTRGCAGGPIKFY